MTEKEQILYILNNYNIETLEDFLFTYFSIFEKQFSALRINELIGGLNENILSPKISKLEMARDVSAERAGYLKTYLEGKMYTSKEAEAQNKSTQIQNADAIINICKL